MIILEKELLRMVRDVSEDKMYDTIEFNEFLTMIGKQSKNSISKESLVEAFK
jgi:Ca2+-binding EF-hand superfamily protein